MKIKMIKELADDFLSANQWADGETIGDFIKFLKAKNKIRKCGTPDDSGMLPKPPDLILVDLD